MPEPTQQQNPSKPWIIKKLASASWEKHPWAQLMWPRGICILQEFVYLLHLASLFLLTFRLSELTIQDNLVKLHNHNLCGSIGALILVSFMSCLHFVSDLFLIWIPLGNLWITLNMAYNWHLCVFQARPNCSGGFKQEKYCSRLVCAVGKRSLQQLSGARRCILVLLFTLFTQMFIVLLSANHMTPSDRLLIMVVRDLSSPIVTNTVTGSCTLAHTMDRLLSPGVVQKAVLLQNLRYWSSNSPVFGLVDIAAKSDTNNLIIQNVLRVLRITASLRVVFFVNLLVLFRLLVHL